MVLVVVLVVVVVVVVVLVICSIAGVDSEALQLPSSC